MGSNALFHLIRTVAMLCRSPSAAYSRRLRRAVRGALYHRLVAAGSEPHGAHLGSRRRDSADQVRGRRLLAAGRAGRSVCRLWPRGTSPEAEGARVRRRRRRPRGAAAPRGGARRRAVRRRLSGPVASPGRCRCPPRLRCPARPRSAVPTAAPPTDRKRSSSAICEVERPRSLRNSLFYTLRSGWRAPVAIATRNGVAYSGDTATGSSTALPRSPRAVKAVTEYHPGRAHSEQQPARRRRGGVSRGPSTSAR